MRPADGRAPAHPLRRGCSARRRRLRRVRGAVRAGQPHHRARARGRPDGPARLRLLLQDDITLVVRTDALQLKVTPLEEWVIRLTAPDTYARLSALAASHRAEVTRRTGVETASLFFVSIFGRTARRHLPGRGRSARRARPAPASIARPRAHLGVGRGPGRARADPGRRVRLPPRRSTSSRSSASSTGWSPAPDGSRSCSGWRPSADERGVGPGRGVRAPARRWAARSATPRRGSPPRASARGRG